MYPDGREVCRVCNAAAVWRNDVAMDVLARVRHWFVSVVGLKAMDDGGKAPGGTGPDTPTGTTHDRFCDLPVKLFERPKLIAVCRKYGSRHANAPLGVTLGVITTTRTRPTRHT